MEAVPKRSHCSRGPPRARFETAALDSHGGLTRVSPVKRMHAATVGTSRALDTETNQGSTKMFWDIIGFLIFGLVVGALARLIKPGKQNLSLVMTLLLGVAGSLIGGIIASLLGTGNIFELNIIGAIVAIIAAVLLIGVAESTSGKKAHV